MIAQVSGNHHGAEAPSSIRTATPIRPTAMEIHSVAKPDQIPVVDRPDDAEPQRTCRRHDEPVAELQDNL